jgi:hypothetical protein
MLYAPVLIFGGIEGVGYLCDPFPRAPHRRWWRWDVKEGHEDLS